MKLIHEMSVETAKEIRWVLTDIDDTMTKDGRLVKEAYSALCELASSGLHVIAVTGRSAGWGDVHLQEWPITGAITENGAISFFRFEDGSVGELIFPDSMPNTAKDIQQCVHKAFIAVPRAKVACDNHLRRFDYAIDHAEYVVPPLNEQEIRTIIDIFEHAGCQAKPSSIHINCWQGSANKREAALRFLSAREKYQDVVDKKRVLYVGDALNDEVMFEYFPNSCAVANVEVYLDRMKFHPTWVSSQSFGHGFADIAHTLLEKRRLT